MESSASIRTEHPSGPNHVKNEPSKLRTIGFAFAIILGLGGLAVAGVGLSGYLQERSINSMVMMATGGVGGIILIIGIIGSVKNCQKSSNIEHHRSDQHVSTSITSQADIKNADIKNIEFRMPERQTQNAEPFGRAEWETYFGDIGDAPDLPDDIEAILNRPCPFSKDTNMKVRDTHKLVLVPANIDGQPVTLNMLQDLIQNPKQGRGTKFRIYDGSFVEKEHGDKPVEKSYWVLMTRDVIPDSRWKSYTHQKAMLKEKAYALPRVIEAVACILAEFVASGIYLYGSNPITLTRCEETVEGHPVTIGDFYSDGLLVDYNNYKAEDFGVAALLRFSTQTT